MLIHFLELYIINDSFFIYLQVMMICPLFFKLTKYSVCVATVLVLCILTLLFMATNAAKFTYLTLAGFALDICMTFV